MKKRKLMAFILMLSMIVSMIPATVMAADATRLIIHYFIDSSERSEEQAQHYGENITVMPFNADSAGVLQQASYDNFGYVLVYELDGAAADEYIAIVNPLDSKYPSDKRYVRAEKGLAEIWLVDGDPRVYSEPKLVDIPLLQQDGKLYMAVEDSLDLLDIQTYSYGKNSYRFDGNAVGTVDILYVLLSTYDYFEINIENNKVLYNSNSNNLGDTTGITYRNFDGFLKDGKYYMSTGQMERAFQKKYMAVGGSHYVLDKTFVAYDTITYAEDPEDVGFNGELFSVIDDFIQDEVDRGFPGATVIIVKDGKIVKESAYGYAKKYATTLKDDGTYEKAVLMDKDDWEPVSVDTLYDLASNSKMYATNYAIQKLVSEGLLDLDRTLQSYPGWENFKDENTIYTGVHTEAANPGKGKETITIRDILHHSAGLIPDPEYPNKGQAGDLWYQTTDHTQREEIIDIICKTPLRYNPKGNTVYSDVDYMILGLLVEQITGIPLDEYTETEIYGAMGLENTVFNPLDKGFKETDVAATETNGNTRDGNISFGYTEDGEEVYIRKYTLQGEVHDEKAWYAMAGVAGHAGLFSNVYDMAALTQLMQNGGIYNGNQIFTQEVADHFLITNPNSGGASYGLGWRKNSTSGWYSYFQWGASRSTYGHQGWTGTLSLIDPVNDMNIIMLTNLRHSVITSPPNGFEGSNYYTGSFTRVLQRIYNALLTEQEVSQDYFDIEIMAEMDQVAVGENITYTAGVYPENVEGLNVSWETLHPDIAIIDENGMLTGISEGETIVRAYIEEYPNVYAEAAVTVTASQEEIPVESVTIIGVTDLSLLRKKQTLQLDVVVLPENATDSTITWVSSNPNVIEVDENGFVTAVGYGMARVHAVAHNGLDYVVLIRVA